MCVLSSAKFGPTSTTCRTTSVNFGPISATGFADVCEAWADISTTGLRADFDPPLWPTKSTKGLDRVPELDRVRPTLADLDQICADVDQGLARIPRTLDRFRQMSCRIRPSLAQFGPTWAVAGHSSTEVGPMLTDFGLASTKLGPASTPGVAGQLDRKDSCAASCTAFRPGLPLRSIMGLGPLVGRLLRARVREPTDRRIAWLRCASRRRRASSTWPASR